MDTDTKQHVPAKPQVFMTDGAARRITTQLQKRGAGVGLRLGVKQYGCSGYAYEMDYADAVESGDLVFEHNGAKVLVQPEHLMFLDGVTVDFRRDGLNEVFAFENPNVDDACGCGESFTLKADESP